jgi:hypothetical protein
MLKEFKKPPKLLIEVTTTTRQFCSKKGMVWQMNFLVKIVDFNNNVFYATPGDRCGCRTLGARDKAEKFTIKKAALDTIVRMKRMQEMRNYVYHIEQVNEPV